jgi:hypothetical protein
VKKHSGKKAGTLSAEKTIGSAHDIYSDPKWDMSFEISPKTEKLAQEMMDATGLTYGEIVTKALAAYVRRN